MDGIGGSLTGSRLPMMTPTLGNQVPPHMQFLNHAVQSQYLNQFPQFHETPRTVIDFNNGAARETPLEDSSASPVITNLVPSSAANQPLSTTLTSVPSNETSANQNLFGVDSEDDDSDFENLSSEFVSDEWESASDESGSYDYAENQLIVPDIDNDLPSVSEANELLAIAANSPYANLRPLNVRQAVEQQVLLNTLYPQEMLARMQHGLLQGSPLLAREGRWPAQYGQADLETLLAEQQRAQDIQTEQSALDPAAASVFQGILADLMTESELSQRLSRMPSVDLPSLIELAEETGNKKLLAHLQWLGIEVLSKRNKSKKKKTIKKPPGQSKQDIIAKQKEDKNLDSGSQTVSQTKFFVSQCHNLKRLVSS